MNALAFVAALLIAALAVVGTVRVISFAARALLSGCRTLAAAARRAARAAWSGVRRVPPAPAPPTHSDLAMLAMASAMSAMASAISAAGDRARGCTCGGVRGAHAAGCGKRPSA